MFSMLLSRLRISFRSTLMARLDLTSTSISTFAILSRGIGVRLCGVALGKGKNTATKAAAQAHKFQH
jgi:hypothetical protein